VPRWNRLTAAAALAASFANAQAPDSGTPRIEIRRVSEAPVIDGVLDDATWRDAAVIGNLVQMRPISQGEPTEASMIYLAYDDEALYIGGRFLDSEPDQISAKILRQGQGLPDDDRLAVIIDPFNTSRSGYRFELNPNGVRVDALYENPTRFTTNWDSIWEGTATRDGAGWSTEMAIPFKSLSFDPARDAWAMNFGRAIRRKGEENVWVSRNREYGPGVVGLVTGFAGMDQGLGLDIVPSISAVHSRQFGPRLDDGELDPSLDVFYRVTPSLNAALTMNTDFSATEVDSRQVNLTRFSLFFPEQRDFFLRDSDLFEFGNIGARGFSSRDNTATDRPSQENARPFFSRRIGLSSGGIPVDLEYGGKLSGRVGRFTVGALSVRQDAFAGLEASNAFVGRVATNVLDESNVGIIVTDGDPNSTLDNSVAGVDFRFLNTRLAGGRRVEGEVWLQASDTEGLTDDDSAWGVGLRMPNNSGWRGGVGLKRIEANFNPALGFVSRSGIEEQTGEVGYTFVRDAGYVQEIFAGMDYHHVDFLTGGLQSQTIAATPLEIQSRGRDNFKLRYIASKENVLSAFELYSDSSRAVSVMPGRYSYERYGFDVETGGQRTVSMNFTYREGGFYGGDRLHLETGVNWKPSPRFFMNVSYDWNDIDLPDGRFISLLTNLETGVVFSSKLSWVTLFQYDNISETVGINSRLHWIPREGQEGIIVLNHDLQDFDKDNSFDSLGADLALKFNYTFRF
jgi:hypothetical protein